MANTPTHPTSRMVGVLMALHGVDQADIADAAEVSEATISRRLRSGKWSADELDKLARYFDVPISTMFGDPDDIARFVRELSPSTDRPGWVIDLTQPQLWDADPEPVAA